MGNRTRFATVLLAALIALPAPAAAMHPQVRQGWLLGFSIGGGGAELTQGGSSSNREGGFAAGFRGGYAFNSQIAAELYTHGWTKEEGGTTTSFNVSSAAVSYYPGGQGFVLRGGLGFGSASASVRIDNSTLSETQTGFGYLLGAGYELRVGRGFALSPQVDYGWMSLSDFDANFVNGSLGLTWYFLPKP